MNRYRFVKQLGDGTYGSVILATMLDTEEKVAIKRMKKKYYSWDECLNLREVKSLRKLNHINIVKLKEVIRENDMLYFVFEYMKENLYQMIKDRDKVFPESSVRNVMYQVLQGLAFMHKHGFFHRDLKPENLLCSGPELVKIADFGLAREIRSRPPYTDYVSTRWYRAPEVLLRSTQYSSPIDIWAVGSIMAEVYTLRPLFPGSSEIDQLFKVTSVLGTPSKSEWPEGHKLAAAMNFKWPTMVPTPLKQLIPSAGPEGLELMRLSMLWDPQKRPSAAAVLRHNYFKVGQNLGSKVTTPSHRPSNAPQVEALANHKPMYRAPVKAVHEQENKPPSGSMYKPAAQPKPHVKKDPFALSIKKSGRKRWGVSDSTDDWGDDLDASFSLSKKPAAGHHHVTKPSYAPPPPKKDDDFEDILASKNFGQGNAKPVLPKIQNNRVNSGRSSASSAKQVYMSKSRYMPGKNPLGSGKKDSATSNWGSPINKPANIGGMNLNRTNAPIGGSTFNAGSNAGNNYVPSFGGSASKNNNYRPGGWKRAEPAPLSLNNPSANRQPVKVTGRTDWASKYLKS